MKNPLNPRLYEILCRQRGGERDVAITSPGVRLQYRVEFDAERRRYDLKPLVTGEYYVMTCPFCAKKGKLYVNHAWQTTVLDERGTPHYRLTDKLATCFYCHAEQEFVADDRKTMDADSRRRVNKLVKYFSGYCGDAATKFVRSVTDADVEAVFVPPPPVTLLRDLPADHPARQYLLHRPGHPVDPDYISDVYGIGVADQYPFSESDDIITVSHQRAYNRIILPIVKDGAVVGWQGRVVDDDDPRPRWYFPNGAKKFPFRNWDTAAQYRGVILVEGFFDEVAVGPSGLTIFTMNMNGQKAEMVAKQWPIIVIALDVKETQLEVIEKNGLKRPGGCHKVAGKIAECKLGNRVYIFYYPAGATGKDPSAMGPHAFWKAMEGQLPKEVLDAVSNPR